MLSSRGCLQCLSFARSIFLTKSSARFSGKSIRPVSLRGGKNITLQKSTNLPLQTLLFSCLKFLFRKIRCAVNIPLKIITNKAIKSNEKKNQNICLGIYNSRLNPIISTEIIIACSRLSVSGVDRKYGRGTSGVWWEKGAPSPTPLVPRPFFRSLTEFLEQAKII